MSNGTKRMRSKLLQVYVLPTEYEFYQRNATAHGLGLSAWVRQALTKESARAQRSLRQLEIVRGLDRAGE